MNTLFRSCRLPVAVLALGMCAALGIAQDPKPKPATSTAPAVDVSAAQKKLDALRDRLEKARSDFMDAFLAEKDPAARKKLLDNRPWQAFVTELEALAKEAKGTDVAARCWMMVGQLGLETDKNDVTIRAIDALVAEHIGSPEIDGLPEMIGGIASGPYKETACATLEKLLDTSPRKEVQAGALFQLASLGMRPDSGPDRQNEARAMFERLGKDYAGIHSPQGHEFKALAERCIFELDNLQVGKVAPVFESVDENGVKFKLSDYRGKVVVLDFWGFW